MNKITPRSALLDLIKRNYPCSGRVGRQQVDLEKMLRIHCMQHRFSYSDLQVGDALYQVESIRRFVGLSHVTDALPGESTIQKLQFRYLLEKNGLMAKFQRLQNLHLNSVAFRLDNIYILRMKHST